MFQYLDSPVKFKQLVSISLLIAVLLTFTEHFFYRKTCKLSLEQTAWVSEAIDQVYRLLKDTHPDGASFVQSIRHILKVLN